MSDPTEGPLPHRSLTQRLRGKLARSTMEVGLRVLGRFGDLRNARTLRSRVSPANPPPTCLSPWQRVAVEAMADRMCAADVPYGGPGAPPRPGEVGVADFFDRYLAAADREVRDQCLMLVGFVEQAWPLLAGGFPHRFSTLAPRTQDLLLARLEQAPLAPLRAGFAALKALTMMGYYRDPRTWGLLGYDGPRVDRPLTGWTPLRFLRPTDAADSGGTLGEG